MQINPKPLDEIDRKLLQLLQQDAELTHKQLGLLLNRSATPVRERIKRLKKDGFIKKFTTLLDPKMVGRGLTAYTQITIGKHKQRALIDFQKQVVALPEVMECYHMNGHYDFLLRIALRDIAEYNTILMGKLSALKGVETMHTFFVLSELKYETGYTL